MKRAAKKVRARLKAVASEIRKSAPGLPRVKKLKPVAPRNPRKARRTPIVITPAEMEAARAGLRSIAHGETLSAFAVHCLTSALCEQLTPLAEAQAPRLLRVAAAASADEPLLRTVALMLQYRLIYQRFAAHQHDVRRLRPLIAEGMELVKQAYVAAGWSDPVLLAWTECALSDLQKRQADLPPDPEAELADDEDDDGEEELEGGE